MHCRLSVPQCIVCVQILFYDLQRKWLSMKNTLDGFEAGGIVKSLCVSLTATRRLNSKAVLSPQMRHFHVHIQDHLKLFYPLA